VLKEENKTAIILSTDSDVSEIKELASSLGYDVLQSFVQQRERPDANYYFGRGKLDDIKEFINDPGEPIVSCGNKACGGVGLVLVNGELKPSQQFNMEDILGADVYDRIRLILEIFSSRANRREAKLQVELARLRYEVPFVRELIGKARMGEQPGFMGGGEYQVSDYYEMIKKRMKRIRTELGRIEDERRTRRKTRERRGFSMVSLVGYTNAGKSSLLAALSGEEVLVEDRLFSTLSTTTRKLPKNLPKVLLTDTVGFIRDLPHWLVESFHSTLEEAGLSDVVVLVVDASDAAADMKEKIEVSLKELATLGSDSPMLMALNKIDKISEAELEEKLSAARYIAASENCRVVAISTKTAKGLETFTEQLYDLLPDLITIRIRIPIEKDSASFISWLHSNCKISEKDYTLDFLTLRCTCGFTAYVSILSKAPELGMEIEVY